MASEDLHTYMMERIFMATHSTRYSNTPSRHSFPPPKKISHKPNFSHYSVEISRASDPPHTLLKSPIIGECNYCTCGNQMTQPQNLKQHFLHTQYRYGLNSGPSHLKKCLIPVLLLLDLNGR